jgi:hypothetical protein
MRNPGRVDSYLSIHRPIISGEVFMTGEAWLSIGLLMLVVLLLVKPVGAFLARVYEFQPLFGLDKLFGLLDQLCRAA